MKKTVLFVDDEPKIIHGLRRMFRNMRSTWEMHFASSGAEALQVLVSRHVDFIITDLRMPGMNGAQLLEEAVRSHPHTVRVVLSGYQNEQLAMETAKYAHRFFAKPCDGELLKNMVETTGRLRRLIGNQELLAFISGIGSIPSLPDIYFALTAEMSNPNSSIKQVGEIIAKDVSMTAKVLQLVNSAFFGLSRKISDPQQAVALLGLDTLRCLVLYLHIFSSFKSVQLPLGFSLDEFKRHSMSVGMLAKKIILTEEGDGQKAGEAQVAGLLHDLGKLILLKADDYYPRVLEHTRQKACTFAAAEYDLFDTSHAEAGGYLLCLWGIPEPVVEAVATHHMFPRQVEGRGDVLELAEVVRAANLLVRQSHAAGGADERSQLELLEQQLSPWAKGRLSHWFAISKQID